MKTLKTLIKTIDAIFSFALKYTLALTFLASPYIVYKAYDEMKTQHLMNRNHLTVSDKLMDMSGKMQLKDRTVKLGRIAAGQEK